MSDELDMDGYSAAISAAQAAYDAHPKIRAAEDLYQTALYESERAYEEARDAANRAYQHTVDTDPEIQEIVAAINAVHKKYPAEREALMNDLSRI